MDRAAAHTRIDELAALGPGWDSYGARPITPTAIAAAHALVTAAPVEPSFVCPTSGGGVQVEYAGSSIEVEVKPDGGLAYLDARADDHEHWVEVEDAALDAVLALVAPR